MGLGASGKSSIEAVVFDGKTPMEVADYQATINYSRSTRNFIDSSFQIIDCGGQELFLSSFIGDHAEFIFTDVSILIWVVDLSNFDQVSTGKFYFDHAVKRLHEFSPNAEIFCFLHKSDLLNPAMHDEITANMKTFFTPPVELKIHFRLTSMHNDSVFLAVGEMIRRLIVQDSKGNSLSEAIHAFVRKNDEIIGITFYNKEGLPLFTHGGDRSRQVLQPSDLNSSNHQRILSEFTRNSVFNITLETDRNFFIFKRVNKGLILSVITLKTAPLQITQIKADELVDVLYTLV